MVTKPWGGFIKIAEKNEHAGRNPPFEVPEMKKY